MFAKESEYNIVIVCTSVSLGSIFQCTTVFCGRVSVRTIERLRFLSPPTDRLRRQVSQCIPSVSELSCYVNINDIYSCIIVCCFCLPLSCQCLMLNDVSDQRPACCDFACLAHPSVSCDWTLSTFCLPFSSSFRRPLRLPLLRVCKR